MNTLSGLMPIVKRAADDIANFTGTAEEAARSSDIADAAEILAVVVPLVDAFARGEVVTPDDVRMALDGMDEALDAFDQEIARQDTTGTTG